MNTVCHLFEFYQNAHHNLHLKYLLYAFYFSIVQFQFLNNINTMILSAGTNECAKNCRTENKRAHEKKISLTQIEM